MGSGLRAPRGIPPASSKVTVHSFVLKLYIYTLLIYKTNSFTHDLCIFARFTNKKQLKLPDEESEEIVAPKRKTHKQGTKPATVR